MKSPLISAITERIFNLTLTVDVEQMSLTKNAFKFFNLIHIQKTGASSLFQPPSSQIKGNIRAVNSATPIVGLFWATSVKSKYTFIQRSDIPYAIDPIGIAEPCTVYLNSSQTTPDFWQ
jgi:hypothetical protein